MSHPCRAITFTDVTVLLVMLALLVPITANVVQRNAETANRVKCGSNLRQIGQAILLYAIDNSGSYPRTAFTPGALPTQYTGVHAPNPFGPTGPHPNDVTAPLFLLLRTQEISYEPFVCPSTDRRPWPHAGDDALKRSNFSGETVLSYSLANPYPANTPASADFRWDDKLPTDFAVAADMNPGQGNGYDAAAVQLNSSPRDMQRGTTPNHQRAAQNVLSADGHVEFQQNPFFGVRRDNIYTISGGDDGDPPTSSQITGAPRWAGDSVLLPVATVDPPPYRENKPVPYVLLSVAMLVAITIAVVVMRNRTGRRDA
jgi:hypothetical protein